MIGKKSRLTVLMVLLTFVILILCSCSGLVEVFIQIVNEHSGTIFLSLFNSEDDGIKVYSDFPVESGCTAKITLDFAEGYYMTFVTQIEYLPYVWEEEIDGIQTHKIPWVNGKTYYIGDECKGDWICIL